MDLNMISAVTASTYSAYDTEGVKKATAETKTKESDVNEGVVYEKSSDETAKKATYSINKMSAEDRNALVKQLQDEQAAIQQNFVNMVTKMFTDQGKSFAQATDSDSIWKMLASGDFTVDAATKAQAQEDISEDGYWGIKQTSQRLFDFASALAGDDVEKMKEMQSAMEKGFKEATGTWGKDLPELSQNTFTAANKLFEDYYSSKQTVTE